MRLVFAIFVLATLVACSNNAVDLEKLGADRVVVITMKDNHFEPDRIEVKRGETIAFRFVNRGQTRHDAFIGDAQEQDDHEREMRMADGDEYAGHAVGDEDAVTLEPGKMAILKRSFRDEGETLIGCHEPGHYDDGMVATMMVT